MPNDDMHACIRSVWTVERRSPHRLRQKIWEGTDMLENHYQIRLDQDHRRRDLIRALGQPRLSTRWRDRCISLVSCLALLFLAWFV